MIQKKKQIRLVINLIYEARLRLFKKILIEIDKRNVTCFKDKRIKTKRGGLLFFPL